MRCTQCNRSYHVRYHTCINNFRTSKESHLRSPRCPYESKGTWQHNKKLTSQLGPRLLIEIRDHFVYAPSHWEAMLQCNIIPHWLGAYKKMIPERLTKSKSNWSMDNEITHFPLVLHICINELGQHWFRKWLVTYSAPSHHLNRCWVIVYWNLRNKFQWNFNQNTKLFIHENPSETIVCQKTAILSTGRLVKCM